jgi:16S rRNA C1402 (ribose-2'-O) methylase RsmI
MASHQHPESSSQYPASPGTLFIVGTPIGNMEDITLRALRVLREADLIAAEDTRHTGQLLARHGIKKPLISYHEFNEARRTPELLQKLQEGLKIALVSDAGMPTLSDPGTRLIRAVEAANRARMLGTGYRIQDAGNKMQDAGNKMQDAGYRIQDAGNKMQDAGCRIQDAGNKMQDNTTGNGPASSNQYPVTSNQYPVTSNQYPVTSNQYPVTSNQYPATSIEAVPGPSALTAALAISGLSGGPFLFHGFLPHKGGQRRKVLANLAALPCALVFFESPYRIQKTLADMLEILGDRHAVVARELTKKFEEVMRDNLSHLLKSLENRRIKGEITLIVEGRKE